MALKPAKAAAKPKLASGSKPAKAAKGATKPKAEKETSFKVDSVVQFAGYKAEQEDPLFSEGDRVKIVAKKKNEDNQTVYEIIAEGDADQYAKDADSVEGEEVFASELKKAEVVPVDPYAIEIPETERLTELLAEHDGDALATAKAMQDDMAENLFYLGGVLGQLYKGAHFRTLGSYDDEVVNEKPRYGSGWNTFCEEHFGMGGRKADGLIRMYRQFAGIEGLDLKALSKDKRLGWVKLERIATVITPENAEKLLTESRDMNVEEVREMIRTDYVGGNASEGETRGSGPRMKRVTITARFFEDQAAGVQLVLNEVQKQFGFKTGEETLELIIMTYANDHMDEKLVTKARRDAKAKRKELKQSGIDISEREAQARKLEEHISDDEGEAEEAGENAAE